MAISAVKRLADEFTKQLLDVKESIEADHRAEQRLREKWHLPHPDVTDDDLRRHRPEDTPLVITYPLLMCYGDEDIKGAIIPDSRAERTANRHLTEWTYGRDCTYHDGVRDALNEARTDVERTIITNFAKRHRDILNKVRVGGTLDYWDDEREWCVDRDAVRKIAGIPS